MSRTSKQRRDARKKKRANRGSRATAKSAPTATARSSFEASAPDPATTSDSAGLDSETRQDVHDAQLTALLRFLYARVEDALYVAIRELYEELCPDDDPYAAYELTLPERAAADLVLEIIRVLAGGWPNNPETSAA